MKKTIYFLICTAFLACGEAKKEPTQEKTAPVNNFEEFSAEFVEEYWKINPISASYQGYHKYDSLLPIPNETTKKKKLEFASLWLERLKEFDFEPLEEQDKIDYQIIENQLSSYDFYMNKFKSGEWNPGAYNLGGAFFQVINFRDEDLNKRLENLSKKLDHIPAYYTAAKANLKTLTKVHTQLAISQLEGSKSVFQGTLIDSLEASSMDDSFKENFKEKVEAAATAIDGFVSQLKEIQPTLADNAKSFRIGKELFEEKFSAEIQSAYTAEEIFQFAVSEKEELHDQLYRLSGDLWEKYYGDQEKPGGRFDQIQMVFDAVAKTHVHRDSFITAIRKQIPQLENFVRENDLLTLDPEKPLVVRETPEYMRGFAGASISAPGPYDKNAETYYNVTPLDHYTEEEAESYLREYNHYTLQILNIHEAIPGHYTQLVYSNQSPSLIKSIFGNGSMIEGWAVYSELMMLENGFGDNLELGFMYYKWNLRTVCNTILDYGIHVLDFTEEDAMQLLMKEAFQEKSEAEGKWKRARLSQVQLCSYFNGYYEIRALRSELQELMGEDFDLKQFHEDFLSYGSAPVKFIRTLMLKKLDSSKKAV